MLLVYFLAHPIMWAVPWILQSSGYYFILKKMGLNEKTAVIPFLAEREFCKVLMRYMSTFYRPFFITVILIAGAYYLGPYAGMGRLYMILAFIIYGFFMLRLYWRICKSFHKSIPFFIGMILIAPLFLLILGLGKSEYHPLDLKPIPERNRVMTMVRRVVVGLISAAEILAMGVGVSFVTNTQLPYPFLVEYFQQETNQLIAGMDMKDSYISRAEELDDQTFIDGLEPSREHFFPDHSEDKSVVVFSYLIGSDLEKKSGLASLNLEQMIDATKEGSGLKFVLEIGGSKRWFTKGIADESYGRYVIENGTLTKVEDLPSNTNLSDQQPLEDFLKWGKENYEADRYILTFWDHGGGFTTGFGCDDLNQTKPFNIISTNEIVSAIDASGLKFDIIGFDACLMQDIELSAALEPYCDYFLASEESESAYGWYYTAPFGLFAKNPGIDSEEFFKEMLSSYDAYNEALMQTDEPLMYTLSIVDTTLAKPTYDKLSEFWIRCADAIEQDPRAYAYIGTAVNNTVIFEDNCAIDLIGFLQNLDGIDYEDMIYPHEQFEDLIKRLQACVLYRNKNTFDGIYGIALTFPYTDIGMYSYSYDQFKAFNYSEQASLENKIFSIMAVKKAQQHAQHQDDAKPIDFWQVIQNPSNLEFWFLDLVYVDYTQKEWYEAGFENYDTTPMILDIPMEPAEAGYKIQLPDHAWNIMLDCQTMVFKKNDDGTMTYLGTDYIGQDDDQGHPLIDFDGHWVHINGQIVSYEAQGVRESEKGDIFYGQVPAMLNGNTEILLDVEWNALSDTEAMPTGKVVGYEYPKTEFDLGMPEAKGIEKLKAGDSLQFMFQTYDDQGNLLSTEPSGKIIRITKQNRLNVEDAKVENGTYEYSAVLKDVYQRDFHSEPIVVTIK